MHPHRPALAGSVYVAAIEFPSTAADDSCPAGIGEAPHPAIAIAAIATVGMPRGFLPRGLSNTYPPGLEGPRIRSPRAGVGQP
jgi:hypothetical protein